MQEGFAELEGQASDWFESEGIAADRRLVARTADMRYAGQNYELPLPVPAGPLTEQTLAALAEGFARAHQQRFGFVAEGEDVQLVTLRVEATGVVPKAEFQPQADAGPSADGAIIGRREVYMPEVGGMVDCPIYARDRLRSGNRFSGPAIIEQMDATTVLLPDTEARVDPYLNVILEV